MNFSSLQLSKFFLLLTISALLLLTYISYQRLQDLISYSELVDHTNQVRLELEQSLSYIKDTETGQGKFLLTHDSIFLEPLINAVDQIDKSLSNLDSLLHDSPVQWENVQQFRLLNQKRIGIMTTILDESHRAEFSKSLEKAYLIRGKIAMDEIRSLSRKMIDQEEKLLKKHEENRSKYFKLTPRLIMGLMLFSLTLILISYFIIIGELKKQNLMKEELENKIDALNRSNSELEQFAYVASHDLQEPLRKIQSFGDRLSVKYNTLLDADGRFIIDRMQNAASRMQLLINDLLAFSRLMQKDQQIYLKTDLNMLMHNIQSDLQVLIDEKKAIIKTDTLPVIMAVPSQMHQLFQNLINNALKFSKVHTAPVIHIRYALASGREIKNVKHTQEHMHFHKIQVVDNGIGFDKQYADKIFIIFQRLHGRMEYGGSGIGLAVCKKIVSAYNGYIEAESEEGKGAVFTVYLPA